MRESARLVRHGTVGGVPLLIDVTRIETAIAVKVTLTQNYAIEHPPGMLTRPGLTGVAAANLEYPRTIASGTTLALFKHEADALVIAGAATYA
jgi:hypothetical protein